MENQELSNWKTSKTSLLPDFIIGGAMKSGTSTLHNILHRHPDIFIPNGEVHFFDIDNPFQHRDFNFYNEEAEKWTYQFIQDNPQKLWDWYLSQFEEHESYLKGEDSTTYLASKKAAKRISLQDKDIKLIFLLRHPTKRAYSQYHHMLRSGRAIYSFEDTIKYNPGSILQRSLYKEQLENYYRYISEQRIKIVVFENFINNTEKTVRQICKFLEIDFDEFDKDVLQTHSNKAKFPRFTRLQLYQNRLLRMMGNFHHLNTSHASPIPNKNEASFLGKGIKKLHRLINPLKNTEKPPIKKSTQEFLDNFFFNKLRGLDELTGQKILPVWFEEKFS